MKKIFLTLIALLSCLIMTMDLYAQDKAYLPILESGKEWRWIICNSNTVQKPDTFVMKAVNKFEENGHEVFLLFRYNLYSDDLYSDDSDKDPTEPLEELLNARKAYEENGVLWYRARQYEDDVYLPMIDFNLEVGDTVEEDEYNAGYDSSKVIWKKNLLIEGVERCVIAYGIPRQGCRVDYWIEGIGVIIDRFMSSLDVAFGTPGEGIYMSECWMGDKCLFDKSRFDVAVAEVNSLTVQNESKDICDMMGRRISSPAPGQLYIRDGKKYIGK